MTITESQQAGTTSLTTPTTKAQQAWPETGQQTTEPPRTDAGGRVTEGAPAKRRRRIPSIGLILAWAIVAAALLWVVAPGLFTAYDPISGVAAEKLQAPSIAHLFGTDALGRDLFARVVHGAVHSLSGAFIAVAVGLVAGTSIGLVAGSVGGILDAVLMRVIDVLLSIPGLLLALTIIILLGFGTVNAAIAVGVGSIAAFARLSRSEVVRVRRTDYVEAAFGSGARLPIVLLRHVLPNSIAPVVALAALQFGVAILAISTLGFLGYGAPPPTPEWGLLIAEGRNYVATSWWLTTFPGIVVVLVVLATNRISQWIGGERA
ncbi:ABC transporter permease [Glaciibacter superstes]|uniref:ABC transporter permease n=1 Tax=Glaciibacter superstes TaxID=501023 RepID=UPI0003B6CF1D|nr:ABC transporter permease [Glaciibacter superstes]